MGLSDEILVARELAALRGAKLDTLRAVQLVVDGIAEPVLRQQLAAVRAALEAGGQAAPTGSALCATLARGDAATADSLTRLADGLEVKEAAVHAQWRMKAALLAIAAFGSFFLTGLGWQGRGFERLYAQFSSELPWLTSATLKVLWLCRVIGPFLFLLVVPIVLWRRRLPGTDTLHTAASLLQFSSAAESGVSEAVALRLVDARGSSLAESQGLALNAVDRALLSSLSANAGAPLAARALALELENEGSARVRQMTWAMLALYVAATLALVLGVLLALYLPIFSIAGTIK